jgi:hypothetical protein
VWCVCALVPAVALMAPRARADDITQVTLTDSGPDRPIPAGSPFYLAGTADETTQAVQVVVVRTGYPSLFVPGGTSCSQLATDLVTSTPGPLCDAGSHNAGDVFKKATSHRDLPALVSATWKRGDKSGKQDYKILVSAGDDFFSAGHTYCLFLLEDSHVVDTKTVAGLLERVGKEVAACSASAPHCVSNALGQFRRALVNAVSGPDVQNRTDVIAAAEKVLGAATGLGRKIDAVGNTTPLLDPEPAGFGAPPSPWRRVGQDDLASVLAVRLTGVKGGLLPVVVPASGKSQTAVAAHIAHYTTDAAVDVAYLQVLDDELHVRVAHDDQPRKKDAAPVLDVTTDKVVLGVGVTVRDFLLLGQGKLQLGTDVLTFAELATRVRALSMTAAWTDTDTKLVTDAKDKLGAMSDVVKSAVDAVQARCPDYAKDPAKNAAACAASVGAPDGDDWVAYHLVEWLRGRKLALAGADPTGLHTTTNALNGILTAKAALDAQAKALQVTTDKVAATRTATMQIRFDQKTWVFTYLTPVVGYASLVDSFTVFYTAVQLHLWPNPTNDPLWSHGAADLRRAFALEAGIAPVSGSFGPDGRYTGLGSVPPIFLGVAVHVVPYTSVTVGQVLLERRSSTLPAESPKFHSEWFVGFNVQVNVPDLIHQLSTPTSSTSVTNQ